METFRRFEKKYLIDKYQQKLLLDKIAPFILPDIYQNYSLMSIYFDNKQNSLIRRSIEKPFYKEKLRIRTYSPPSSDDEVYVEIKKKLDGVVYKRRTKAKYGELMDDIYKAKFKDQQVGEEIKYFLNYYGHLEPSYFITCERESYVGKDDKNLRITIDSDMKYRTNNLKLEKTKDDKPINDLCILEIKADEVMPLWLANALDELKIYPTPFSKVGMAYLKENQNGNLSNNL